MKQLLVLAMLGAFGAAMVGCEASAKVGDPDTSGHGGTVYKKETKTTDTPTGTKTETKVETNP